MRIFVYFLIVFASAAYASEIKLLAIMGGNRAMVEIDGSKPHLLALGQSFNGVKLLSINADGATFDVAGARQTLSMDNRSFKDSIGRGNIPTSKTMILPMENDGHFFAHIALNGMPLRGMVDTGATTLAISSTHARMAGLNFSQAPIGRAQTAQGTVATRQVRIDVVKFGDITLYNVDATIVEGDFPSVPLIGMNILQRFTMQREADRLTLIQRY